ncbi:VOC family protein [Rhizorhabdus wittichii]|uniref:VOC family protein n=2 Tax=Rhizorhabdus wittichii TaxID=160791 RepID=A0A975HEN8_9SPHN|nr:VOC family protein [Rhizorhabdus wittichii]
MKETEMRNLLGGQFHQIAYVTADFDAGLAALRAGHGIERFLELRDIRFPVDRAGAEAHCHIALGRTGGLEIELIQPLGGAADLYREPLDRPGPLHFHHVAQRVDTLAELEALHRTARERGFAIPIDSESNGMTYFYADARATLGHHVEYIYGSPDYWAAVGAMIPEN